MKVHTVIPFLLFVLVTSCGAQEQPASCLSVADDGVHDFGDITHADRPEHRFVLRNICNDTVRITHVKAACGCTTAMLSGRTLGPGDAAMIDVTFYPPRTTNGHVSKSVAVWVDGGKQQQYVLRVEADIRSFFRAVPDKPDLGSLRRQHPAEAVVRLENVSDETMEITEILSALSIEFRGGDEVPPRVVPIEDAVFTPRQFTLAPGEGQDITIRFTPQLEGTLLGSIVVYSASETRQVEVTGTIRK
ncbi:MAG: DUF1573 domain-containing protein [Bacteroidetes bacterium]|nr:DUF1573 domain-containing protein [Bacteroidota bacterium]